MLMRDIPEMLLPFSDEHMIKTGMRKVEIDENGNLKVTYMNGEEETLGEELFSGVIAAKEAAEAAESNAAQSAEEAASSASAAEASAYSAAFDAGSASSSAASASESASAADLRAVAAENSAQYAVEKATQSGEYMLASQQARNDAVSAKNTAVSAKDAALSAQGAAESARAEAAAFSGAAFSSAARAETAQTGAEAAQDAAEDAKTAAEEARDEAEEAAYQTVRVSPQDLTEAQQSQARSNIGAAAPDGYYGDAGLGAATAENLIDVKAMGVPREFTFSPTAGTASVTEEGTASVEKISGNTMVWNQLADAELASWEKNSIISVSTVGRRTTLLSTSGSSNVKYAEFRAIPGHKYLVTGILTPVGAAVRIGIYSYAGTTYEDTTGYSSSTPAGTVIDHIYSTENANKTFRINLSGLATAGKGGHIDDLQVYDLTKMFGAGNEPTTPEAFRAVFSGYYVYNAGTMRHFSATGIKTVGFNLLDPSSGAAELLGGMQYQITGSYSALAYSTGAAISPNSDGIFTPAADGTLTVTGFDEDTCVHFVHSGYRNGDEETYWTRTLLLPIETYFPGGMKSSGEAADELLPDKAIKRVGTRAHQSGDESDVTVITDGVTTCYPLSTPVVTQISPPLNLNYRVSDHGTEQILPFNASAPAVTPFRGIIKYGADFPREIANLPRNYISTSSIDDLLSVLGQLHGGTFTKAYNAESGKYEFTFTPSAAGEE